MSYDEAPRYLARRAQLEGPWLDRLEADEVRGRLAKVGGFRFVRVRYDLVEGEPGVRDVVFEIEPGQRWTVDLLAGFRSYEMLYGGVDAVHRNAFGLGHTLQFRAVQSFKSTEGALTYTIPDALGEDVTVFVRLDALSREEVSFRREELRSTLGTRWLGIGGGHELGARYSYEILRAVDAPTLGGVPRSEDPTQPDVASLGLDWTWDRRDSVVLPRSGYRLAADLEVAMPEFGGEARFLRPALEASWHRNLRGGRYLHLGLQHTVAVDPSDDGLLPFNKRIFPGGEDSVRGYQRGEAGPLNADGEVIGAESALVWNVELEQLLTGTWSLVAFVDGVAQAEELKDFPADEVLWSAGLGLRWNTVIGPVRFEYGHNLDRRDGDPQGTWHFSVGFPF
jgi:outer membrane protein assembly factor BamA